MEWETKSLQQLRTSQKHTRSSGGCNKRVCASSMTANLLLSHIGKKRTLIDEDDFVCYVTVKKKSRKCECKCPSTTSHVQTIGFDEKDTKQIL